jgi:hypothetical protein
LPIGKGSKILNIVRQTEIKILSVKKDSKILSAVRQTEFKKWPPQKEFEK